MLKGSHVPPILLPDLVNPNLKMGFKAQRGLSERQVRELWERVTDQALKDELALGTGFAMPTEATQAALPA